MADWLDAFGTVSAGFILALVITYHVGLIDDDFIESIGLGWFLDKDDDA